MKLKVDPQLHILRSVAGSLEDPRQRHEAMSARHQLYAALEDNDMAGAQHWLEALEVSLATAGVFEGTTVVSAPVRSAIDTIRKSLGTKGAQ